MATTSTSTFGALLRHYRLAAGLTQEALAERAGVSSRGVQDLERGVRLAPRAETLRLLADALALDGAARAGLIAAAHPELISPPTARAVPLRQAALPVPATPLVGREHEVAAACALLRRPEVRLLTLTGPGGVGKTRLALAVAAELAGDFADGAAWIDLAPTHDPELVAAVLAGVLGVRENGEQAQALAELLALALADRHLLLVLDNLEHLLAAAPLLAQLLAVGPHLTVLTTSRVRLRLRGEQELPVLPLALPAATEIVQPPLAGLAGVAAVRLFVERAGEVHHEFALTPENAPAVAAICRQLDGLPLAIELAAALVKLLPPASLLARLERRLPLLTGGARDLPPRQQTMRDTIAWSYDLLSEPEQTLFRHMTVFTGGCTLEAVEGVAASPQGVPLRSGGVAFGSGGEAGKETDDGSGPAPRGAAPPEAAQPPPPPEGATRPAPPEPKAAPPERSDSPSTLAGITTLLEHSLVQRVEGPGGEPRIAMLETIREYGLERLAERGEADAARDAHAAYFLALAEAAEVGLQGAEQVAWLDRLQAEHDNLRSALHWLPARGRVEDALHLAGAIWFFRWIRGYYAESRTQYEALLALPDAAERTAARARALNGLGVTALSQGDTHRAVAAHEEALAITRDLGDERGAAFSLVCLGAALMGRGEYDRAVAVTTESLTLCRKRDDRWGIHLALGLLAFAALHQGDHERAEARYGESLAVGRALGVRWSTALNLNNLGWLALDRGDDRRASELFEEALTMMDELGDRRDRPDALAGLGRALQRQGDLERAVALYEESLAIARETGDQRGIAQALLRLGDAAWQQGNIETALKLTHQALALFDAMGNLVHIASSVEAIADLAAAQGEARRAARLLGAAAGLLERVGAAIPGSERFAHDDAATPLREGLGEAAFAAAWESGRALTQEQTVAEALVWADAAL